MKWQTHWDWEARVSRLLWEQLFTIVKYLMTLPNWNVRYGLESDSRDDRGLCLKFSRWTFTKGNFIWHGSKCIVFQLIKDILRFICQVLKGGLISESFSLWPKSLKKNPKSLFWASSLFVDSAKDCHFGRFWRFEPKRKIFWD
jgi:hypothetical protein